MTNFWNGFEKEAVAGKMMKAYLKVTKATPKAKPTSIKALLDHKNSLSGSIRGFLEKMKKKAAPAPFRFGGYAMDLVKSQKPVAKAVSVAKNVMKATPATPRPAATFSNVAKRARNYVDL